MMKKLFANIDSNDLINLIDTDLKRNIIEITGKDVSTLEDKEVLINIILSSYGFDLFIEKKIRQLIFYNLDFERLQYLYSKYCKNKFTKPYDMAIELSLVPWKNGSEFQNEIISILDIPNTYFTDNTNSLTTYEILPYKKFYPLHDYQNELKENIINSLNIVNINRFLVQMPTGAGKTRTVLQSALEYSISKKILSDKIIIWLAHTEELCEQAIETLNYLWGHIGNEEIKITKLWGAHQPIINDINGGVIFGTFQKVASYLKNDSVLIEHLNKNAAILIIDEAHKSVATTYATLINKIIEESEIKLIGITATPGRAFNNDLENKKLVSFYNKVLLTPSFDKNPILELQEKGILSKLKRNVINTNVKLSIKLKNNENDDINYDLPTLALDTLAKNIDRNKLLIDIIKNEINNNNPCLVFTCNTFHSKLLSCILNILGIRTHYIDSNTNKLRRKKIISDFKNSKFDVLLNYGILTTGFDAPRVRSIIVARPTSSIVLYSQIIGRGLRGPKMGGGQYCNLFDLKDNFDSFGGVDEVYNYFEDYWA